MKHIEAGFQIDLDTGDVDSVSSMSREPMTKDYWTYILPDNIMLDENSKLTPSDQDIIKSTWEYFCIFYKNAMYKTEVNDNAKVVRYRAISNFTIRVLYHILRGKVNKRVIEMVNDRGRKSVLDIETKQLVSLGSFKEMCEGQGNYRFTGKEADLMCIKRKLYDEERSSIQLETLGWHKHGFYTFANGLYNSVFHPVDEYGIVSYRDHHYYIPYANAADDFTFINERKFSFKSNVSIDASKWVEYYYKSFGTLSMVPIMYGISCMFSDIVYRTKNNFPMLFLHGEGGSGKSSLALYLSYWFGEPQQPLKLSEKANTDKAKIRKLAMFVNAIITLEEFINRLDPSMIKTLTGFYDRLGYERATIDSKYGTEVVPISSGVIITGNEFPIDDPLMQRLILVDYNANVRTDEQVQYFFLLQDICHKGVTNILGELLQMRSHIEEAYTPLYRKVLDDFRKVTENIQCPDRMRENYASLLAMYACVHDRIKLPFTWEEFIVMCIKLLKSHADKRDVGSQVSKFWETVLFLINSHKIAVDKDYQFDGNRLFIRLEGIYSFYLEAHPKLWQEPGLGKSTLKEKLKGSVAFVEVKEYHRYSQEMRSNAYVFEYSKIGIDLLGKMEEKNKSG